MLVMDTMEDSGTSPASDKAEQSIGKEPAVESTTFFTEELYRQLAGPAPTLEESVSQLMDALGYDPPSRIANGSGRRRMHRAGPSTRDSSVASSDGKGKDDIFIHPSSGICRAKREKVTSSDARSEEQIPSPGETALAVEDNVSSVPASDSAVSSHEAKLSVPQKKELSAAPQNTESAQDNQPYSSVSQKEETVGSLGAVSGGYSSDSVPSQRAEKPAEHGERISDLDSRPQNTATASDDPDKTMKGKRPPMPESRKSSLRHEQHVRYLELFKKCTKRFLTGILQPPTEEELQELKEFEKLQVMVAKEQEDCQNYLKQLAQHNPFLYVTLSPHVMKYMQDKDESNWRRADSYAHYYNQHALLPLTSSTLSVTGLPMLMLVQTLVQLGSKCRLHMPDLSPNPTAKSRRTVPMDVHKISSRFPPVRDSKQHGPSGSAWNHEPASKDSNMESLVHKYQCHIATSVSVIQQLLDNHAPDYSTEWDIPVVIREYKQGSASQKVVYLDKPLLPRGLGQCQRKTHFLQKAVRAYMCQPHNNRVTAIGKARTGAQKGQGSGQESEAPGRKDGVGRALGDAGHREVGGGAGSHDDDDPFGASVSMEDLETFGSDRLFSQSGWKMPDQKPQTPESVQKTGTDKYVKNTEFATGKVQASAGDKQNRVDLSTTVAEPSQDSSGRSAEPVLGSSDSSEVPLKETKDSSPSKVCALPHQLTHDLDHNASSDSDDDGLVIADVETPETKQSGGNTGGPTQSLRRDSRSSRSSIFDEVALPPANTAQSSLGLTPRRVTRSAAHKLQSPESPSASTAAESPARATRQAAKRKLQEQSQAEDRGDSVESQSLESNEHKGSKTEVSSTKLSSSAKQSSSAEPSSSATPSSSAKRSKQIGAVAAHAAEETRKSGTGRAINQSLAMPSQGGEKSAVSSAGGHTQVGKSAGGKPGVKKEAVSATPLDSIMKEMAPSGDRTSLKFQAEDPSQYHQPLCTGDHVSYHLWNLSGMSVMIRCNNHAFIRDMRLQQKGVYLRAKAERQVHYGLEQVTLSECVRAWLGCYLRPNSYLLRARVNMQTQEVVHVEELQLDQILQPTLNFSPQCAFAVLQNVFSTLMELPAGSYLLSHAAGSDHIQLKAGTGTKRGGFDLRCGYMGLGVGKERDKVIPWVPIDPTLVLPHHWRLGLIPATFQPPDFDSKRKQQRQFSGPKKKNKNRNKNKKTQQ